MRKWRSDKRKKKGKKIKWMKGWREKEKRREAEANGVGKDIEGNFTCWESKGVKERGGGGRGWRRASHVCLFAFNFIHTPLASRCGDSCAVFASTSHRSQNIRWRYWYRVYGNGPAPSECLTRRWSFVGFLHIYKSQANDWMKSYFWPRPPHQAIFRSLCTQPSFCNQPQEKLHDP